MTKYLAAAFAVSLLAQPISASADVKVGAVLSLTGPAASLGIPERNAIELMPTEIGGEKVTYIVLDDASDPTITVRNARKLIDEEKVDVIIGPTTTPSSLALLEVVGPARTPMISLAGSQVIVLPPEGNRRWVFKMAPKESIMAQRIFDHFAANNGKTLAMMAVSTAFGDSFSQELAKAADARKVPIVAWEKYNQTDTSVTPQALKLMAANPDGILFAVAGTPGATPIIELRQRGYKGTVYFPQAIANPDFLRVGGKSVDGAFFPVSPTLVAEQLSDANPVKKVAMEFNARYEQKHGAGTRNLFGASAWDSFLLLRAVMPDALRTAKPGTVEFRTALRDNMEKVKNLVGTQGVFNMTEQDHSGADERAQVLVRIDNGKYVLVKE